VFKHVLVATDGSPRSERAVKAAIALAESLRAKLTCVHVTITFEPSLLIDGIYYGTKIATQQYTQFAQKEASRALRKFDAMACKAGIAPDSLVVTADEPWEGILEAAHRNRCDVIVMASHGRRGVAGFLLGSETTKVLTHSKVPVLVYR
jgi:nucleotide-binding universal stress UspA family protein